MKKLEVLFVALITLTVAIFYCFKSEQRVREDAKEALTLSAENLVQDVNNINDSNYKLSQIILHYGTYLEKNKNLIVEVINLEVPGKNGNVTFDQNMPFDKDLLQGLEQVIQQHYDMRRSLRMLFQEHPTINNYAVFKTDLKKIEGVMEGFQESWKAYQKAAETYNNKKLVSDPEAFKLQSYPQ